MAEGLLSEILLATIQAFVPAGRTEDRHRNPLPPRRLAHALGRLFRPLARRNRKFEVKNITQIIKKLSTANYAIESFFCLSLCHKVHAHTALPLYRQQANCFPHYTLYISTRYTRPLRIYNNNSPTYRRT